MGTITVGSVIDQFERKILDESNDDTTEEENISFFNNTIRTMINLVPKIHSVTEGTLLAPGVLQFLPAKGFELVDIPLNMGSDGSTPGAPLRESTLKIFNEVWPQWATDPQAIVIEHFMKDDNEERRFYVYPPVHTQEPVYVLIQMSTLPTPVTYDVSNDWKLLNIPVEDQYIDAIINGMLYMFYDDDSDNPGNTPRSQIFYGRFQQALQLETMKPRQRQS
jgi:hypothetical protein